MIDTITNIGVLPPPSKERQAAQNLVANLFETLINDMFEGIYDENFAESNYASFLGKPLGEQIAYSHSVEQLITLIQEAMTPPTDPKGASHEHSPAA
jgi:hypothetical protein